MITDLDHRHGKLIPPHPIAAPHMLILLRLLVGLGLMCLAPLMLAILRDFGILPYGIDHIPRRL
jgi:hypothetical protein